MMVLITYDVSTESEGGKRRLRRVARQCENFGQRVQNSVFECLVTPAEEEQKAKELTDYYRICFAHPAVEGILMWGFWEGANWITVSSLYKRDWTPTPAAKAYKDLIFNEWWTKESGVAGKDGTFSIPAFYGKYRITVNGVSREADLKKDEKSLTVDFTKKRK